MDITRNLRNAPTSLLALAILLGFVLRVYRIDFPKLTFDELTSILFTREPWHRLLGDLWSADVHPAYYYSAQKLWNATFGTGRLEMHLFSVLCGVLCIPLLYVLARRFIGTTEALIASFILATSQNHLYQSRELRMYSLLNLSVLISLIGLAYVVPSDDRTSSNLDDPRRRAIAWLAYVGGAISAFYAHNTAALLPVLAAVVFLVLFLRGVISANVCIEFLAANVLLLLATLPQFPAIAAHVSPQSDNNRYIADLSTYSQITGAYPYPWWAKPIIVLLFVFGAWSLKTRPNALVFVLTFVVGQPLLMWLIGYFKPVFIVRALVWPTMLSTILIAAALALRKSVAQRAIATAAVCLIQIFAIAQYYPTQPQEDDFSEMKAVFGKFDPEQDQLLLGGQWIEIHLRYEMPDLFRKGAIAVNYGDKLLFLDFLLKSRFVPRADALKLRFMTGRLWIVSEITPSYPIPADQDVSDTLNQIASRGETTVSQTDQNYRLIVVRMRDAERAFP